ncbi:uncharacterized protein [Macrobrachium rosenbergii]|uniref:uncharacterized protein n=1 Tax=Macrobrachium rosenbergii TaxID=79674 RepID=UPI0034D56E04
MLNPKTFLIDYEQAAKSAIEEVFPNATIKGCFYHLSQSIYSKVQYEGLQSKYQTDANFALQIRMIPALAFVSPDTVIEEFETLQETLPPETDPVIDYFEDTYISRKRRHARRTPRFPVSTWNMYDLVVDDIPRTNNSLEGWHDHMQASITSFHPNIWKCLEVLKREQALTSVTISQMLAGHTAPPTRKRYLDSSVTLEEAYEDLLDDEEMPAEFITYFDLAYIGIVRGRGARRRREPPTVHSRSLYGMLISVFFKI